MQATTDTRHALDAPSWRGKRATLEWLRPSMRRSLVADGVGVTRVTWGSARAETLRTIARRFGCAHIAVRSDAADEDMVDGSDAGRYRSVLAIVANDGESVAQAIEAVFLSCVRPDPRDEVFIQRQVAPIRHACVAFTHALPDAAPYYVVSLATGPRTDAVTRGDADVDTWYVARDRAAEVAVPDAVRTCLDVLREVEAVAGMPPCEIELVLDAQGTAWLLQARALARTRHDERATQCVRRKVEAVLAREAEPPLLGMMPDWNPAELLGEHPRPLARTLFDRLLTRRAWSIGRAALGHAAGGRDLLRFHAGRPYVDVRTSFRSLLPASLDARLGRRLVDAACARLRAHPQQHDKVEFEVMPSALRFGFETWFATRYAEAFDRSDITALTTALREPMRHALDRTRTARLLAGFERDVSLQAPTAHATPIARWLSRLELRTAVRFAEAARQAFMLEALMCSAVEHGALDGSVLRELRSSATAGRIGGDDDDHVRAGTFEIAAPARREWMLGTARMAQTVTVLPLRKYDASRLAAALTTLGVTAEADAIFAHYIDVLHTREFGKFALARAVSLGLDALGAHARTLGIAHDEAGWLELDELLDPRAEVRALRTAAMTARRRHAIEAGVRMPLLIDGARLDVVHHAAGLPNYVGHGLIDGRVVRVEATTHPEHVPLRSIVAIASADPGYDWIFLRQPLALVTAFGGPNSHMAIRCTAAGVPALLGVGPEAFRRIADGATVAIDFETRAWTKA